MVFNLIKQMGFKFGDCKKLI